MTHFYLVTNLVDWSKSIRPPAKFFQTDDVKMTIVPTIPGKIAGHHAQLVGCKISTAKKLLFVLLFLVTAAGLHCEAKAEVPQQRRLKLLQDRYEKRRATFEKDMAALAAECERQSYFTDAENIRKRALPPEAGAYDLDQLPTTILPPIAATLPENERLWRTKVRNTEAAFALDLYKIARDSLREGYPSITYQLVREVAFHDSDNRFARSMLGYVQDRTHWVTPYMKLMAARGFVDNPQFGWIPSKHEARYEAGERFFEGKWVSAEKEASIRTDFSYAWSIGTEHFDVRTDHSFEKGVEISRKLEVFNDFFMKEYAAFFNSSQQMEKLLDLGPRPKWDESARYRVNYYKSKAEFVAALQQRQPGIERATGLYMPSDRTVYFYYQDPNEDSETTAAEREGTMYHELTHQLLGQSRKGNYDVGEHSGFWVVEGFACYMETFQPSRQGNKVGDPRNIRIYYARKKIVEEQVYFPLLKFTSVGREAFPLQAEAYNQAAALVHFVLNANDGEFRDAFIQYLSAIYDPMIRKKPTLEEALGVRFEELDARFVEYMKHLPSDPPPGLNEIAKP